MKNSFILFALLLLALSAAGQEPDTTRNEEKQVVTDTVPTPTTKPEVKEEDEMPRIIYYQSSSDEPTKREKRQDIKTLSGSMSHSGGFGALSFRSTKFREESVVMAGLRGGWIINRTLGIGVEGHGIIPTAKFDDVALNTEVNLLGGYGGMFLELIFFSNEVVHVTFPISGGAGWLGYYRSNESNTSPMPVDDEIDSDVFWYVEPGADLEFNISRNFRLAMGVSKRYSQDLELLNAAGDDFDNLNYFITLKIGGF